MVSVFGWSHHVKHASKAGDFAGFFLVPRLLVSEPIENLWAMWSVNCKNITSWIYNEVFLF